MSHKIDIDTNSGSKPKVDLNDIEMVFGTPNTPRNGAKPEIHVANERTHGRDVHTTSKEGKDSDVEAHSAQPLLEPDKEPPKPPLAGPEIDDLDEVDDHPKTTYPGIDDGLLEPSDPGHKYPGIDDGLLEPASHHGGNEGGSDKEGHGGSHHSHDSHHPTHDEGVGTDDGKWWASHDEADHADHPYSFGSVNGLEPRFGLGNGPISPIPDTTPDANTYQQRKNLAQGMMDLALLSANANQLRYVLESSSHPYYYPSLTFIAISIIFQVIVGVLLILNSRYDVTDKAEICKAVKINNFTVLGVFLVTIVNVFITSFSVAPPANIPVSNVVQAG